MDKEFKGVKLSLEGINGAGKTTMALLLAEKLNALNYEVHIAYSGYPDNNMVGLYSFAYSRIFEAYQKFNRNGFPVQESLMVSALSSFLDQTMIRKYLENGTVVICDRDVDSYFAYGLPGLKEVYPEKTTDELLKWMISTTTLGRIYPDMTILFKTHMEKYLSRATVGQSPSNKKRTFSPMEIAYLKEVAANFKLLKAAFPSRIKLIDPENFTQQQLLKKITPLITNFLHTKSAKPDHV